MLIRGVDDILCVHVRCATLPTNNQHESSGQSLKAEAVIPDTPHCPVGSKPVVFENRYQVQKHSCYDGDGCVSGGRKAQDSY